MEKTIAIIEEAKKAVSGKDDVLKWILAAILAGGHILLEDMPGVGKTTIALAFSRAMGLSYGRVQFTPDVLPSDITGYSMYVKESGKLEYQPGAVLCNLFLGDELNRATSRTQSALLEAMEEGSVTVDGITHKLPEPFIVFATQNPVGAAGTQLLPDSQMDRFMVRLSVGYPSKDAEMELIRNRQKHNPLDDIEAVMDADELRWLKDLVSNVYVDDEIVEYIIALVRATRDCENVNRGASPRASLAMTAMAKSVAYLNGRNYVVPADVQTVYIPTVAHRLVLSPEAEARGVMAETILAELLRKTPVPKI